MEFAKLIAELITALAGAVVAYAAWIQLPMISKQVKALAEQIELSRVAEANAERRMREWETLKACQLYDFDPTLDAATQRIWIASEHGKNYLRPEIDVRDMICILNYLDGLATCIEQKLYIEEVIKDHLSPIFKHAVVNFLDTKRVSPDGLEKLQDIYKRWFRPSLSTNYKSGEP